MGGRMKKKTLDKLRRYIDLASNQAAASFTAPLVFRQDAGRDQLWQEFVEAVQGEIHLPPLDDPRLDPRSLKDGVLLDRGQDDISTVS